MVKIISPYAGESSPIAQAFSALGQAAFGDTLTPELKRQQAYRLSSQNQGVADTSNAVEQLARNPSDPAAWARAAGTFVAAGRDPGELSMIQRGLLSAVHGAADPRATNAYIGAGGSYANTVPGFREGQATERYKADQSQATERYKFDNTPVEAMTADGPRFTTRAQAPGQTPLASEAAVKGGYIAQNWGSIGTLPVPEQNILGATRRESEPEMVQLQRRRNQLWNAAGRLPLGDPAREQLQREGDETDLYIKHKIAGSQGFMIQQPDGTVISMGGTAGGDAATARNLNASVRNIGETRSLIKTAVDLVDRNPGIVGAVGNFRRIGQDVASIAGEITRNFGGQEQYAAVVERARQDLAAKGLESMLPGLFNPDLNSIETVNTLLLYKAAESLGQQGNGVSDKDIARMSQMVGDPTSWTTSAETYKNKLIAMDRALAYREQAHAKEIGRKTGQPASIEMPSQAEVVTPVGKDQARMPGGAPAPGQVDGRAAAPTAPASPPAAIPEGATATNPQTGQKIQFRGGQWVPI
ncbi:hypothetical protein [Xanthobacter flavus]|uniref:hypothetical protein n=1 Tax=Xanthobacter flavus TaxID=281 RepID=UPI00372B9846